MRNKNILTRGKKRTIGITGLFVIISLIALIFNIILTNNLKDKVAVNQIKLFSERTESEASSFFEQLNTDLKLISGIVQTGIFDKNEVEAWSSALNVDLQSNRNISSLSVIDKYGNEYYASLKDSTLIYYQTDNNELNTVHVCSKNLETNSVTSIDTVFANRAINLESYTQQLSIQPDSVVWYKIQPLPGFSKTLGLAASVKTVEETSGDESIVTIYVSVRKIYKFLQTIATNMNAELFLFTRDKNILDLENKSDSVNESKFSDFFVRADSIESPVYRKAISKWENISKKDSLQFRSFKLDKQKYWGAFKPVQKRASKLWIALIVPEDDFLTVLKDKLGIVFFIPIFILIVSVVVLIIVIRRDLKMRKKESPGIVEILKLIEKGENEYVEFKSTVRTNLFTNNPGKEIELAWLKSVVGFCNSNGGIILIGVNDDGEIVGLEADKFANDDKCLLHVQNLLKDHVGMEFSDYINYRLHTIDDKKFLAVHCSPAPKPLFLISNQKEQFYVRSGPASIELPISKALKYIEDRKSKQAH